MAANPDIEHFARLIDTLNPWLDQVVIIGGWAHRLYRLHPLAQPLDYEPLGTLDTDVAVPAQLPATGEIRQRLLENGFREELMGEMQPPAAHYHVATDDSGFYAEFLTPLIGGAIKRGGKRDATTQIAGVSAQKLRHLELLLECSMGGDDRAREWLPDGWCSAGSRSERGSFSGTENPHPRQT